MVTQVNLMGIMIIAMEATPIKSGVFRKIFNGMHESVVHFGQLVHSCCDLKW